MNTLVPYRPLDVIKARTKTWGILGTFLRVLLGVVMIAIAPKLLQALFWWIVLGCLAFFIHWTIEAANRKAYAMDHPLPIVYELHAEGVWAQIEEALRTIPSFLENVSVHIDESQPIPPPDQPLFIQATFKIFHPELFDHKDALPNQDKSLTSKLVMRAWIESFDEGSRLTFIWTSMPIQSREVHDQVITAISTTVDTLVKGHIEKM